MIIHSYKRDRTNSKNSEELRCQSIVSNKDFLRMGSKEVYNENGIEREERTLRLIYIRSRRVI